MDPVRKTRCPRTQRTIGEPHPHRAAPPNRVVAAAPSRLPGLLQLPTPAPALNQRTRRHDGLLDSPTLHVKLALVATAGALIAWRLRRPAEHVIEAFVFLVSLAIVWLGLALAHGPLPFG